MSTPTTPEDKDTRHSAFLSVHAQRSAPLPAPAELEHYDRIVPGMAERIVRMAEQEQAHRGEQARKWLDATVANAARGQWLGGITILAAIIGALAIAVLHDSWQIGVALVSVPVLGAVQALIRGRESNQ
jgi:uncharacterized membrane protein